MNDPIGTGPLHHPLGRRRFMALGGGLLAAPLAAEAQQSTGQRHRVELPSSEKVCGPLATSRELTS